MTDTPAHAFAPPLPGYEELASLRLTREIERINLNAEARKAQAAHSIWRLIAIGIVTTALSLGVLAVAANSGLSRAAHHFQISKKV